MQLQSDGVWPSGVNYIRVELQYDNAFTGQREYRELWEKITPATPIAGLNGIRLNGREENAALLFTYNSPSGAYTEEKPMQLPMARLWVKYAAKPYGSLLKKEWIRLEIETNCPIRCGGSLWVRSGTRIQQLPDCKKSKEEYYLPWADETVELLCADKRIQVEKKIERRGKSNGVFLPQMPEKAFCLCDHRRFAEH